MTKTLSELIDKAYKIKVAFKLSSYLLYQYEDGSYVEFRTPFVNDPELILKLAGGLRIQFLGGDPNLIIRMFERYDP